MTGCQPPIKFSQSSDYGRMTLSITWITPLDASMSTARTLAALTMTPLSLTFTVASLPFTVLADVNFTTSLARTLPATTWYVRTATSFSLFSGSNRLSTVPAGNLANASSVGAKTVNGPLPFRVSTRPAGVNAAASVLNEPAATAVSSAFVSESNQQGASPCQEVRG